MINDAGPMSSRRRSRGDKFWVGAVSQRLSNLIPSLADRGKNSGYYKYSAPLEPGGDGGLWVLLGKQFLGCRTGAATESRPYRAFHCCGRCQLRHDRLQTFGSGVSQRLTDQAG
jgi:hypothetical protein